MTEESNQMETTTERETVYGMPPLPPISPSHAGPTGDDGRSPLYQVCVVTD